MSGNRLPPVFETYILALESVFLLNMEHAMSLDLSIKALDYNLFSKYFDMSADELESLDAYLFVADKNPCYPCRVSLQDAEIGETVLAIPYEHHSVQGPYKSTGPIFIRKDAKAASLGVNEIPMMLRHRLLSIRGYSSESLMVEGDTVAGEELQSALEKQFQNGLVEYIHIHNAGPGCFNCEVSRGQQR